MSKIKDARTAHIPKPFIDLPAQQLYISSAFNDQNQITSFFCRYKGIEETFKVENMNIQAAWEKLEKFIVKHNKK